MRAFVLTVSMFVTILTFLKMNVNAANPIIGLAFGNTDETFDNETNAIDREQLQVFVFVLAKGIVSVLMRGNVFVLLRGIVNGDPVDGSCQMFPANIRRYFAFFISTANK